MYVLQLCAMTLGYKANRSAFIQLTLLTTLPRLAAFNSKSFINKLVTIATAILYTVGL
jgi:hypothetical protein